MGLQKWGIMRLFYRPVFNEFVDGTSSRFSSNDLNELLGSAEKLVVQIRAYKISGTSPTLTINVYRSNNGQDATSSVLLNAAALTTGNVYFNMLVSDALYTATPGDQVTFEVKLGGTTPSAQVELVVCGRGESRRNYVPELPRSM